MVDHVDSTVPAGTRINSDLRMFVYLLSHIHEMLDGEDDEKVIGVYATREDV